MNDGMKKTRARSTASKAKLKRAKGTAASPERTTILTIGHSNRALEEFLALLEAHGVGRLVDVRTIPRSRHNPQFNTDSLKKSLNAAGIGYTHMKNLGGLRHAARDSINNGWRNASFRGYADYMQTPEFDATLARLIKFAAKKRCAVMCAEAVPWRCHRSLIADALAARGISVEHIMSRTNRREHSLTPYARVRGIKLTYPEPDGAAV
jgi:uncharacterized protein (DUF488 family)